MELDAGLAVLVGCMHGFHRCRVDSVGVRFLKMRLIVPFLELVLVLGQEMDC